MNAPHKQLKYGNLRRYLLKVAGLFGDQGLRPAQYEQDPIQRAELLAAAAAKRKRRQERNIKNDEMSRFYNPTLKR